MKVSRSLAIRPALLLAVSCVAAAAVAGPPAASEAKKPPRPRLTLSREVTFFTQPLAKDGLVDYAAALNERYGKGVTPENNAAVPILRALGRGSVSDESEPKFADLCRRLGIEPLPADGEYFVQLADFVDDLRGDFERDEAGTAKRLNTTRRRLREQFDRDDWYAVANRCAQAPWSPEEEPLVAAWLDRVENPLDLLRQAGEKPHYFVPYHDNDDDAPLLGPFSVAIRTMRLVEAMRVRAMRSLADGNGQAAWDDVLSMRRWGGRACDAKTLIDQLIGTVLIRSANAAACTVAVKGKFDAPQLRKMQAEWASIRPGPDLAEAFGVGERCFGLHALNLLHRASLDPRWVASLGGIESPPPLDEHGSRWRRMLVALVFDWDAAFKTLNRQYDKLAKIAALPTRRQRQDATLRYEDEIERLAAQKANPYQWFSIATLDHASRRTALARYFAGSWIAAMVMPAITATIDRETESRMEAVLVDVVFALAQYHAVRGAYPEDLAGLTPTLLARVPTDEFDGGNVKYTRTEDGGFLLYSVGRNGKDDVGRTDRPWVDTTVARDGNEPAEESQGDADDVVIRIGGTR